MPHIGRISVDSRDRACRVDVEGDGAQEGARAWSVECGESAVRSAQETVRHVACVNVVSCDCAGSEATISTLKHPFSMGRATYKGDTGFQRYVGWSIITKNLFSLARWRATRRGHAPPG